MANKQLVELLIVLERLNAKNRKMVLDRAKKLLAKQKKIAASLTRGG